MSGLNDKLSGFQQFLKILSWGKIAQFFTFMVFAFLTWAVYENKQSIYNYVTQTKLSKISPVINKLSSKSTNEIDAIVKKSDIIVAIQVLFVDFQQNARVPIYTYSDDPQLTAIYTEFTNRSVGLLPLFTADVNNNKSIIDLINGEYSCYSFDKSFSYKVLPTASNFIKVACGHGVPPFYGRFSGMVVIYLNREPTPEESDQIRNIAKSLSHDVYERDFK